MDVHDRLNQILNERGWTIYKLSKESGLAHETLTNVFKRGTMPSITTLESICNGFKITLSQFFAESDMVEMTPELQQLFEQWIFLTPMQKEALFMTMEAVYGTPRKTESMESKHE